MKAMIATLALACCSAHAEFRDGNKLLNEINSGASFSEGLALGYIMGVTDFSVGVTHCAPPTVTAGQLRDMVKMYLTDNPQHRHVTADAIINRVLSGTRPCPKKGTGT